MTEMGARDTEIRSARQEAAQLEQRVADQTDRASLLAEGQRVLAAVDVELVGADRAKLEKAAAKLEIKTSSEIDKRSVALRESLEQIAKEEKPLDVEVAAANTRTIQRQQGVGRGEQRTGESVRGYRKEIAEVKRERKLGQRCRC
jgi:hypothetical protein